MRPRARRAGFTILEVMLAIGIFSMIMVSIYSVWTGILRASKAARTAADQAQRARVAMRTIQDALLTAQMFNANMPPQNPNAYYSFIADSSGDFTSLSFVAHLPATFPGVGRYGNNIVRRVTFKIVNGKDGALDLVMEQGPMLQAFDSEFEPYTLVLAKDVQKFIIEFWGQQKETRNFEWVNEWNSTNSMPKLIRVLLAVGKTGKKDVAADMVYQVIALPATAVDPTWQNYGMQAPINTNRIPRMK
jgi:general secretion pathway protein J